MRLRPTPAHERCNQRQSRILAKLHMKAGRFKGSLNAKYYDKLWSYMRRYVTAEKEKKGLHAAEEVGDLKARLDAF